MKYLEEKIVSILSVHSTYKMYVYCVSSFGSFLDLLMYDRTATMAVGVLIAMYVQSITQQTST